MSNSVFRKCHPLAAVVLGVSLASFGTVVRDSSETPAAATAGPLSLSFLGRHVSGTGLQGSEIAAYDSGSHRMFITNGSSGIDRLEIVDISVPSAPSLVTTVPLGRALQSVAVKNGLVAVALEGPTRQSPGELRFFDIDGNAADGGVVGGETVVVGALPDMVVFTPDGSKVLTANEGEPDTYCAGNTDPEGSVSVVDVTTRIAQTAEFTAWNGQEAALRASGVRIFGPNATAAQDIEPEYIAVSPDSTTAYVTLQENNAMATVDLTTATVSGISSLGYKDHSVATNSFDSSDRDSSGGGASVNIATHPVLGMYMPDAIASFQSGGDEYLVMSNEGDARDYDCFLGDAPGGGTTTEDRRGGASPGLDPVVFAGQTSNAQLGRLNLSTVFPATVNGSGQLTAAYSYGARSITIRDTVGGVVWDSGNALEQITSTFESPIGTPRFNGDWNTAVGTGTPNGFDTRSDNKGPEPEGLAVGDAYGRKIGVVGLERLGGVAMFDFTNPNAPVLLQYLNTSIFTGNVLNGTAGDVSPEGLVFVNAADSPTGKPLVLVANELSGTTAILELNGPPSVSIGAAVVDEGAGAVDVPVTLSEESSQSVTIDYSTEDGSALEDADYLAGEGTVTFAPGETVRYISVPVLDDLDDEPTESFSVSLSNPTNVLSGTMVASVDITDNDLPVLTIGDASRLEGGYRKRDLMAFNLSLSSASPSPITVSYVAVSGTAVAARDFVRATGSVVFAPGQTTATVTVKIIGDKRVETDEEFTVVLTPGVGVTAGDLIATGTIINDD